MMRRLYLFLISITLATPALAVEVQEVVSPGGIKAWLVEEHSLPLVAVRVSFEGSGYAYDRREGRASLTAAMLTEGAGDMDDQEFAAALEEKAIEFQTAVDEDMLEIWMETLAEHKDTAFSYLSMALTKTRFDSGALDRSKRQALSILKQAEQTPQYLLEREFRKQGYGKHPYSRMQLGSKGDIDRIGRSDLQDYAEGYLTRQNMLVGVVGDITPDELKKLLDKYFLGLPEKYKPDSEVSEVSFAKGSKPVILPYNIPQTQVAFGLPGLKRNDPDYITAYVMNQILGGDGSLLSRLGQEIREKRGLSYSIYSRMQPLTHGASWGGGFATRNDQVMTAIDILRDTLKRFVEEGPTNKEMSDAKRYLTGSFMLNLDSNAELAAFLINMQHNRLGRDYLDKRNAMIEAVNKDDVKAVARRLINPDALTLVMVGNPSVPVKK